MVIVAITRSSSWFSILNRKGIVHEIVTYTNKRNSELGYMIQLGFVFVWPQRSGLEMASNSVDSLEL